MAAGRHVWTRRKVLAGGLSALCGSTSALARPDPRRAPPFRHNGGQFTLTEPPRSVRHVRFRALRGAEIPLARSLGKVVLVNFWATWCPPCRRELLALDRLAAGRDRSKLDVKAVSIDRGGREAVEPFLRKLGVRHLEVLVDPGGALASPDREETGAAFALYALPISYLVDPTGSVVGYFPGEADWTSAEAAALLAYFNTT